MFPRPLEALAESARKELVTFLRGAGHRGWGWGWGWGGRVRRVVHTVGLQLARTPLQPLLPAWRLLPTSLATE